MQKPAVFVPHFHWDREWYEPFQAFRYQLVQLLDDLVPMLEADPSYSRFLLDGQMAVVDDYLEVRPHASERVSRLISDGRLAVGPWYVLMDEFCVSAETFSVVLRTRSCSFSMPSLSVAASPVEPLSR